MGKNLKFFIAPRFFTSRIGVHNLSVNCWVEPRDFYLDTRVYGQIYRHLRRNPKYDLKFLFRAHLPDLGFLVVCSIYKINSRLYSVHRMVYFLEKWQKKPFSSNLSHLAQKWSNQSFKKEIKTRQKEL